MGQTCCKKGADVLQRWVRRVAKRGQTKWKTLYISFNNQDDALSLNDDALSLNDDMLSLNNDALSLNDEGLSLNDDMLSLNDEKPCNNTKIHLSKEVIKLIF